MTQQTTLSKFLILHLSGSKPEANLAALLIDVAAAVKKISSMTSKGALGGYLRQIESNIVQGETLQKLDMRSNDAIIDACEGGGQVVGMVSEKLEAPYDIKTGFSRGRHLLLFNPLDGSSNTDVNVSIGTVFSILGLQGEARPTLASYLQPGSAQLAAGYAIYGPSTMLVISVGSGTHGFTLDREVGNFILTHPHIQIPRQSGEFAINSSNERFWEPPIQRYIRECKAGSTGLRGRDFNMRWIASMIADVHRILMRGGVFIYPTDGHEPDNLRLLCEANPLAMLVTQAGGIASTGRERLTNVQATELHQRVPVVLGSADEVERIERYHAQYEAGTDQEYVSPLFKERSLYRD